MYYRIHVSQASVTCAGTRVPGLTIDRKQFGHRYRTRASSNGRSADVADQYTYTPINVTHIIVRLNID